MTWKIKIDIKINKTKWNTYTQINKMAATSSAILLLCYFPLFMC